MRGFYLLYFTFINFFLHFVGCVHGDRTRYFVVVVVLCSGGAGWQRGLKLGFLGC